jgi:hypothetical protein
MQIDLERLSRILDDAKEEFQREVNQAVLKNNMNQGVAALGGLDAVQRIERRISITLGVSFTDARENKVREMRGKRA